MPVRVKGGAARGGGHAARSQADPPYAGRYLAARPHARRVRGHPPYAGRARDGGLPALGGQA